MRYRLLLLFTVLLCTCATAQIPESVVDLELARIGHQQRAMLILGGWAVGNIGSGLLLRANKTGEDRRFHEMNAIWNVVNLGIAGFGYFSLQGADPSTLDAFGSLRENMTLQKVLLFNAGLDVGYLLGGAYLLERGKRPEANRDLLRGYGKSVMVQGAFLLVFDLVNYFIASGRDDAYGPILGAVGDGIGLSLRF